MKKSPVKNSNQDAYVRVPDYEARLDGLEFPPEVWAVFALMERAVTTPVLAEKLGLEPDVVASAIRRLVRRKLVRKQLLNWRDYLAQAQLSPSSEVTEPKTFEPAPPALSPVAESQLVSVSSGEVITPESTVEGSAISETIVPKEEQQEVIVSVRIVDEAATQKRLKERSDLVRVHLAAERTSIPRIAAKSSSHVATTSSDTAGWRLRPLLDAIIARSGGLAGQFLVYRIFLRLPAELVAAAGIKSLSLVSDDFKIYDPQLREAICEAAREMAGLELAEIKA